MALDFRLPSTIAGLFLIVLSSCSSNISSDSFVARLDSTLTQANKVTRRNNANIIEAFESRQREPITMELANTWLPKAKRIDSFASSIINYIDDLKTNIKNGKEAKEVTINLHSRLIAFKSAMIPIHERMQNVPVFVNNFHYSSDSINSRKWFTDASPSEAVALLTALQNEVLQAEYDCLVICFEQVRVFVEDFTSFEAIVGQNAQVLHVGDSLEITTGMGSFKQDPILSVRINGQKLALNDRGYVVHKLKTQKKPGNYSVPVLLGYTDEDGNRQERTFQVKYRLVNY